jgi:hypothetical protein
MMRLVLAPKSKEGIEEKQNREVKNHAKNTSENYENKKHSSSR